ncbi:MAG: ribosome biogenesis GTPase Der [bacterium]|nr:ribosome biogenesis GTPase Der [bacterium]
MYTLPTIVIIGRRNVGKSALFNRLIEQQKAIVSDIAGTTRDRTEGICLWRGKKVRVVDTGGMDIGEINTIDREVLRQAKFAIKEADIILFMVDARVGPQPSERALAGELRKAKAPILLIANKAETPRLRDAAQDPTWKRLGFDIPFPISAITGVGVGDLLDLIFSTIHIKKASQSQLPRADIKIAIIGKPNVGKSSLLNKLLGEERVIVSPIPHTTREPQDTLLTLEGASKDEQTNVLLIDTAGLRKKAKISGGIEQLGVMKTLETIRHADVVFFILDATELLDVQDKHLASMIEESGSGVVIGINKHDLLEKRDTKGGDLLLKKVHYGLPGLTFAPVVYLSALGGHGSHKLLPLALEIQKNRKRIVPDEELEKILPKLILRHKPTKGKGTRHPVIQRIEQTGTEPPTFLVVIGVRQFLHESYLRYIENRLREFYNFEGTPIKVWVRQEKP